MSFSLSEIARPENDDLAKAAPLMSIANPVINSPFVEPASTS
jgi:hypothetical protein